LFQLRIQTPRADTVAPQVANNRSAINNRLRDIVAHVSGQFSVAAITTLERQTQLAHDSTSGLNTVQNLNRASLAKVALHSGIATILTLLRQLHLANSSTNPMRFIN